MGSSTTLPQASSMRRRRARLRMRRSFGPWWRLRLFPSRRSGWNQDRQQHAVWSRRLGLDIQRRAHRVGQTLDCDIVWINDHYRIDPSSPWGGLRDNGIGSEKNVGAYKAYTQLRS